MQEWIATAPFGLEGLVAEELRGLGMAEVRAENGGARFCGSEVDAFSANLWLRCADRVHLVVGSFPATTFDALFEGVKALPWEKFIPADAKFPVSGNCARSMLMSVSDCQSITKKAIVERLKETYKRTWFEENGATYAITVSLHGDVAQLTLDASGTALNRRGYRTFNGDAPLRETLAAALVELSPWREGMPFCDPMCGTGTLAIEAAMRMARRAPGLTRSFAMENWHFAPKEDMERARLEAAAVFDPSRCHDIFASDIDPQAITLARRHLQQAGMEGCVDFQVRDIKDVHIDMERGAFLSNPPYGERLSDRKSCELLYRDMAFLQRRHPTWSLSCISSHPTFERCYGRRADKKRRFYNGRLECEFMMFYPGGGKTAKKRK